MHDDILVPTDGSGDVTVALDQAFDLATTYNAVILVEVLYFEREWIIAKAEDAQ